MKFIGGARFDQCPNDSFTKSRGWVILSFVLIAGAARRIDGFGEGLPASDPPETPTASTHGAAPITCRI
jgi:hypothetical protein